MPAPLKAAPHLSAEGAEAQYRREKDPVLRSHFHIIWLMLRGDGVTKTADATGYSLEWVREVVHRWNRGGPEGLGDGRHENPGAKPLLSEALFEELRLALQGPPPYGDLWDGPRVAKWAGERLGRVVHPQDGVRWLRKLDYVHRRPRPRHVKADKEAQTGSV